MPSNWISDIAWDSKGPYRTYTADIFGHKSGDRTYVSPAEVSAANTQDPRLLQWAQGNGAPSGGFVRGRGQWNPKTGNWDQPLNGGNLLALGIGSAIAAPAVVGAFAGPGAFSPAGYEAAVGGTSAAPGAAASGGGMFGGFRLGDLLKGGVDLTSMLFGNAANNKRDARSAQAAQDALNFAKQQYGEQNALEQARYNATEARRVPYRKASNDSLIALKQLLWLPR